MSFLLSFVLFAKCHSQTMYSQLNFSSADYISVCAYIINEIMQFANLIIISCLVLIIITTTDNFFTRRSHNKSMFILCGITTFDITQGWIGLDDTLFVLLIICVMRHVMKEQKAIKERERKGTKKDSLKLCCVVPYNKRRMKQIKQSTCSVVDRTRRQDVTTSPVYLHLK